MGDEDVEVVIVDADVFIRLVGGDGGLDDGEGGWGDVELDDVGVLDDEARLYRPENQPDEDDEEDDNHQPEKTAVDLVTFALIVFRHGPEEEELGKKSSCSGSCWDE